MKAVIRHSSFVIRRCDDLSGWGFFASTNHQSRITNHLSRSASP